MVFSVFYFYFHIEDKNDTSHLLSSLPLLYLPHIVTCMGAVPCCGNLKGENTPRGETSNPPTETGGIT